MSSWGVSFWSIWPFLTGWSLTTFWFSRKSQHLPWTRSRFFQKLFQEHFNKRVERRSALSLVCIVFCEKKFCIKIRRQTLLSSTSWPTLPYLSCEEPGLAWLLPILLSLRGHFAGREVSACLVQVIYINAPCRGASVKWHEIHCHVKHKGILPYYM